MTNGDALINNFPSPVVVVTSAGEVVSSNRAFLELASQYKVPATPADLFGSAFIRVLGRAWVERHIQSTAAVVVGEEPRAVFRISFMSTDDERTLGVALQEITTELDLRRMLAERDRDFVVLRDIGVALSSILEIGELAERTTRPPSGPSPARAPTSRSTTPTKRRSRFPATWKTASGGNTPRVRSAMD